MSIMLKDVGKSFGRFQALHSINLHIEASEFIAILGPSGCGKTTLLRMLAGFEQPSSGEIHLNGKCVAASGFSLPPEKRRIGMVFQAFALWPHMNVEEHILFPIRSHKETPAHIKRNERERVGRVLDLVGLSSMASRMPHQLSGGQKQRVAIARAIAPEPSLLLMDEPLSSLDAMLRMDMRREIQNVHRQTGSAIVYVTHDQSEALAMADRIVVMKDGRIEQVGTPQDIYLRPRTEFVARFVSKANLVKGQWQQDRFLPEGHYRRPIGWPGERVGEFFKENGLYPVRPDQFVLGEESGEEPGIRGEIVNVQFQGKEFRYHIRAGSEQWEVICAQPYKLGDRVVVNLAETGT
ncbi:ABC transporter ATP-binding protein [Paenibacillus beijingensis]|uniref:Carnitine transport ATP-binding protein OpuCA n=1 Tax=Paenibacillus beijingensis TaxID=1126833 RepID=A0A0D5NJF7_9BACL|nr:ABC transporter ATP-binding protein [Paenibacillus beijingensis]AJY75401.1 transporter [Paenibacillus beijingensis]